MFCSNCGHELKENEIFCSECGTQNVFNTQQPVNLPSVIPPKKTGKKIAIAVCSILLLAGISSVGILAATGRLSNLFQKNFSNPKEYLQHVMEKNLDNQLEPLNVNYSTYLEKLSETSSSESASMDIELGKSFQSILSMVSPEFGKLESASLKATVQNDESKTNMQILADVNKQDVLTINAYMNTDKKEGYLQIPELSESYLDFSEVLTEMNAELTANSQSYNELMKKMNSSLPDSDALNRIMKRYSTIFWENANDVEQSSAMLEAGNVEQNCTELTLKLDGDYFYNTIYDLLNTLAGDEDIKEILMNIDNDTYDEFFDNLPHALEEFEDNKEDVTSTDTNMQMKLYVDDQDLIVGEELSGTIDDEDFSFILRIPQNGDDFGYFASASFSGTEIFTLAGGGTISDDIMNGEFSFSLDSSLNPDEDYITRTDNLIEFKLSDFDLAALNEGYLNGSMEISSKAIPFISAYSLTLDSKSDKNRSTFTAKINSSRETLLTVVFSSEQGKKLPDFKPSSSDRIYDITDESEIEAYQQELDIEKFINDFSSKTKIKIEASDITNMIENFLNNYDDNYDWDDFDDDSTYDWDESDNSDLFDDDDSFDLDDSFSLGDLDDDSATDFDEDDTSNLIGQYNTVRDFVASPMFQSQLSTLSSSLEGTGMSIDIIGEDNKLIYVFSYDQFTEIDGMAEALASGVEAQSSTFQSVANALKLAVRVKNPILEIRYIDASGKIIYSTTFTAK